MKRFVILFLIAAVSLAADVRLAWDASPEVNLAGYKVYYRCLEQSNFICYNNVGNVTTTTITNLTNGVNYEFTVTAFSDDGLESGYSNILLYKTPNIPSQVKGLEIIK